MLYYKKHRSQKYIYRCLACHYIQSGKSYDEVSLIIGYNRNSIIDWVKKFNNVGIEALLSTRVGRGRKPYISPEKEKALKESVLSLQEERSGGSVTGNDIMKLVSKDYDASYSLSGIYALLSRIGISWVSGRSIHPKTDQAAQESFKKTSH